jgi:4-diphosphocytidyl-2-C-methyl-D-erythritol kinase
MTMTIRAHAPAKLNLTLAVTGRRMDGYHLLDSIVTFTEYGDEVRVAAAGELSLEVAGPFADRLDGPIDGNLVWRAASLLADRVGGKPGARITLTKNLPVASGIGGGSSDAAATLRALAALWQVDLPPAELARIGLALGADVPVCLEGTAARLQGIGEIVTPLPALPPVPVVLVNPLIGLATPPVFKARSGPFSPGGDILSKPPGDAAALAHALAPYGNDLTAAATGLLPVIGRILAHLRQTEACLLARMSGSGATCFALYAEDSEAKAAASAMRRTEPGWWAVATRLASGPPSIQAL